MPKLRHKLISASAGSGKTYQLVRRYLHLLALGADPSRITAVTFTRKAAGEFVNRILLSLSDLADDKGAAKRFLAGLEPAPEKTPEFKQVLRSLLADMPKLRLGTIDSFFAKVAACFPLELGLPVGATIMSEEEERRAKTNTVSHLLARLHRDQDRAASGLLLEGFKQATFGNEEKRVLDAINDWLKKGHDLWHECPDASRWGQPEAVWPRAAHPDAAIWHERKTIAGTLKTLVEVFDGGKLKDKRAIAAWEKIQKQALELTPGQNPPDQLKALIERLGRQMEELRKGGAKIKYQYCDWEFTGPAADAALDFFLAVIGRELHTRCQRTQGIRRVVEAYEADYACTVRSRGRLSFTDLARLLATTQGDGSWADEGSRADLWFRLDGQVDHWLFDEFQDTSIQQWSIMRGLVDEVLQDPEMRRTFFAVGDVKQSIYLWRKAEPALFDHIRRQYPDDGQHGIYLDTLAKSWRSSEEVLALVNGVFSQEEKLLELIGGGALRYWRFERHTAARNVSGFSAFLQPAESGDDEQADEFDLTAAILNEVRPSQRQLTCAVLTRSNKSAVEMTEYLRQQTAFDILSHSEEKPAEDNPATAAVLAVLQLAAHPGDALARQHLRMTPLAGRFATDEAWREVVNETLGVVHESGFAPVVELWTRRIVEVTSMDVFSLRRLEKLEDIAAEFDDSGSRDVDEFLETARSHGLRTGATPGAVQVMTVHKSKGLEFDVVIVPVSDKGSIALADAEGLVMKREGIEPAEWVLQYPTKVYSDLDPVLSAQKQMMDEQSGFEGLCRLYVAMTRAKRALYVVAPRPPRNAAAANTARLLRETLGAEGELGKVGDVPVEWLCKHGEVSWYEVEPIREVKAEPPAVVEPEALGEVLRRHQATARRSTPSGEEAFVMKGSAMFSAGRERGRRMGTLVHDLLSEIEWLGDMKWPEIVSLWKRRGWDRDSSFDDAANSLKPVLEDAKTKVVFQKPSDHTQAWREKPFEVIHEERWISGTMDRVILTRDANGRAVSAWLVDFKSDDVPDEKALHEKIEGYRPQVELYRLAICRLTGLKAGQVRTSLLFIRARKLVEVE